MLENNISKKKIELENQINIDQIILKINDLKTEISKVIIGQKTIINKLLIGLFTGGHILLEGLPGLAKTLIINTIAKCIGAIFKRIQFTPDLLPSDIIGTLMYNQQTSQFMVKKGPIFADIVLADEINRSPSKVQSALLECMQEKQVTIGGETYPLNKYFWVLATENPIEHEGTYTLPEAQLDRFMFKLKIDYPEIENEKLIVQHYLNEKEIKINPIIESKDIEFFHKILKKIYIDPILLNYIIHIVNATRNPLKYNINNPEWIDFGASPRASIYLALAAKGVAFLNARNYVKTNDIKEIVHDVLRHRIILNYEAEDQNSENVIDNILEIIPSP